MWSVSSLPAAASVPAGDRRSPAPLLTGLLQAELSMHCTSCAPCSKLVVACWQHVRRHRGSTVSYSSSVALAHSLLRLP